MQRYRNFAGIAVAIAVLLLSGASKAQESEPAASESRAVLITGASSGIGLRTTEILSAAGVYVYAGARKQADLDALDAMENVEAVRLDVTVQQDIDSAVAQVRDGGRGLHAVVNNAGVAMIGPLVEIPESDLEVTFDVNVAGPYRITKAFLPFLLESKGRVINISSVSGIQANMLFGTYSMSKHALEAYTDVLALELEPFGIDVVAVVPGAFRTKMAANGIAAMKARGLVAENSIYTQIPWDRIEAGMSGDAMNGWPEPDKVAYAIQEALFDAEPKDHYMVVSSQPVAEMTIRKIIEELVRYNEDQEFSFDRDALVQLLDEELSGERDADAFQRFGAEAE